MQESDDSQRDDTDTDVTDEDAGIELVVYTVNEIMKPSVFFFWLRSHQRAIQPATVVNNIKTIQGRFSMFRGVFF